jgi:hypothetical protein
MGHIAEYEHQEQLGTNEQPGRQYGIACEPIIHDIQVLGSVSRCNKTVKYSIQLKQISQCSAVPRI